MAGNRLSRDEFERMVARHRLEMEQASAALNRDHAKFERHLAQIRVRMERAWNAFERAVTQAEQFEAARRYQEQFGAFPDTVRRKRRRRPRGFDGGDPVPVYPKPKPTPLTDGAEAPIE